MVVGQTNQPQPATPSYAASYKTNLKYPEGFNVVADPNWQKMDASILSTSNAIPAHAVLDAETMELKHSSSGNDFPWDAEVKLIKILKSKGLWQP